MKKITFLLIALLVASISYSQVIVDEDFESNSIPPDWSQVALGGYHFWSFGSGVVPGNNVADFPTNAAIFDDDDAGNHPTQQNKAWLRTAMFDFTSYNNYSSFIKVEYTYALNILTDGNETLTFAVWDNDNTDWINLVQYNQDTAPTLATQFIELGTLNVDLTHVSFAFIYDDVDASWGWGAGVDDVKITIIPNNDVCGNAQEMNSFPYTNIQDTTGSINEGFVTPAGCGGGMNDGVWYTFTADGDGEFNIESLTGVYDHEIGVYTGSCGNFNCVDHADSVEAGQPEHLSFNVTYGTQYWINFGYWSDVTDGETLGNLTVHTSYTPTENDTCAQGQDAGAVTLPVQTNIADFASSTPYNGTVLGATDSGVAATVCEGDTGTPNDDVWFKFTATTTSVHITVEENFDSVINLFSGSCGSLSQIGCADNLNQSPVQIDAGGLTVGEEYYIRVFSFETNVLPNSNSAFNISVWTEGGTAGTQENNIAGLSLYPNPITDLLTIEAQEEITKLSIYNQIGQMVKTITPNQTNVSINLENLATGIYIVKIEADDKVSSKRVIKK